MESNSFNVLPGESTNVIILLN